MESSRGTIVKNKAEVLLFYSKVEAKTYHFHKEKKILFSSTGTPPK